MNTDVDSSLLPDRPSASGGHKVLYARRKFVAVAGFLNALLFLAMLGLAGSCPVTAQDVPPTEYQVKAAFLYNFAKFVDWPASAFSDADAPLVIGVVGDSPIEEELQSVVRGKRLNGHPFVVKHLRDPAGISRCHIVFISAAERRRLPDILRAARGSSVLTVSDLDHFLGAGGMIQFLLEENKVRFAINDGAAREAGLRISSKLLNLARRPEHE